MDWFPVVASPVLLSVLVIDVGHDSRVILLVLFLLALFEDIFEAALYRKLIVSLACPLHFLTEQRLVFFNFESSNPRRRLDTIVSDCPLHGFRIQLSSATVVYEYVLFLCYYFSYILAGLVGMTCI